MYRILLIMLAVLLFTAPLSVAQVPSVCDLDLSWAPPGFYADGQCVDITTDPMNTEAQGALLYAIGVRKVGAPTWIPTIQTTTTLHMSNLECGDWEATISSYFEGQSPACPITASATLTPPTPGTCTLILME